MDQIIHNFLIGLNNVGWGFCSYALSMFVQSSVLLILLIIIDFMLRKKVRAVFRYCVWMLVFIKLILPPTLSLPTGIGYWCGDSLSTEHIISKPILDNMLTSGSIRPDFSDDFAISTEASKARPPKVPSESAVAITPVMSENHSKITEPSRDPLSQPPSAPATLIESILTTLSVISWQAIVFLIWVVGVLVFSMLLIQRMLSVLGLIAQSEPAKGRLLETLNQCRKQVCIGRNVDLKLSSHIQSPAVCGLFKPIILMPTSLLKELSNDKLRAVLIHELVHMKRFDLWINFAQTFLQIIYFYNPFVWLANAMVRRIREQAVDEAVLVAMGAEAKSYSNTLIDIAEMAFFKTNFGLCLIGVAESKKALHRRIRHILGRPMPKSARVGVFRIAIIIVIAAVLLPMARAEKPAESEEPDQDVKSAEPVTVDPFVLRIRTFIDGSDYIKIRGASLWYEHQKWDLPGKWWNRLENIKYDEPTYINGEAWKPEWEGRISKPYIMKQVTLPREVNDHINLTKISGRGSVSIAETPKPQNDYTLSILLDDNRYNKAQWYEVVIQSGPRDTTKESAKDDSISSSRESLPQIPAANDVLGTLIFRGQYNHLSRGSDYGQPSVLLLKQTHDKRITAVAHMPFRGTTIIASGDKENRLTRYKQEHSASGNRPGYLMDLELLDNKVLLTRRGVRQDVDGEELRVPEGALFNPNTRPDAYCAANILLRGFNLEKGQSKEFHVYDWDNTGEAFADYTIRVEYAGTENVDVPAGIFEASHFVLTQVTSANTWFKKRAGHVTDFWVLDNGVIVRVLRHREPYEIQLLEYTVPDKLPGHLSAATTPALNQRSEAESVVDTTLYQGRHGSVSGTVRIHGTEVPASGVVVKTISKWFETVQALTDEQGNYTLAGIRPEAVFHISAEDEQKELYVITTEMPAVVLKPGEAKTGVDLTLYQGLKGSISGKVVGRRIFYQKPERLGRNITHKNFERAEDTPLPGVKVVLKTYEKVLEETITDEAGRYRFENLRVNDYVVSAEQPQDAAIDRDNYPSQSRLVKLESEPKSDINLNFRLDGISIAGRLTDTNGNPIGGAKVVAEFYQQGEDEGMPVIKKFGSPVMTLSSEDGRYQLANLPPMIFSDASIYLAHAVLQRWYQLRIQADGYAPAQIKVPPFTENFVKETSQLMEDHKGIFRKDDSLFADVDLPESEGDVITGIDFVLEKEAVILGRVVDTQSNIVAGPRPKAWIQMVLADSRYDNKQASLVQMPDSTGLDWIALDEAGRFKFDRLGAGSYFFEIKTGEYSYDTQRARNEPLEVKAGDVIKELDVIVESAADRGNISGRVLDASSGKPFEAFTVSVAGVDSPVESTPVLGHVKIDGLQKWNFLVEGLSPGTATLEIWAFGSVREKARVKVVSGQTTDRTFHLELGGKISGRVLDARTRKPVETISVKVTGVEPSGGNTPANGQVTIDKSQGGAFLIDGVSQGTATVQILASGYAIEKARVEVVSGQTTERIFHLEEEGKLQVYTTLNGESKAAWVVRARPVGEGPDAEISTQMVKDGRYELTGLKEGEYMVSAPVPLGTGIRGRTTVQINNRAKVHIESGKETRKNFDLRDNAGIRGDFTCSDKNLSWRILVFDDSVRVGDDSVYEVKQAHALVWSLEKGEYYEITCLPAGTYTVVGRCCKKEQGWTPVMEKSRTVTVNDGQIVEVDFAFE